MCVNKIHFHHRRVELFHKSKYSLLEENYCYIYEQQASSSISHILILLRESILWQQADSNPTVPRVNVNAETESRTWSENQQVSCVFLMASDGVIAHKWPWLWHFIDYSNKPLKYHSPHRLVMGRRNEKET